jgi:hypothetical protein
VAEFSLGVRPIDLTPAGRAEPFFLLGIGTKQVNGISEKGG